MKPLSEIKSDALEAAATEYSKARVNKAETITAQELSDIAVHTYLSHIAASISEADEVESVAKMLYTRQMEHEDEFFDDKSPAWKDAGETKDFYITVARAALSVSKIHQIVRGK